MKEKQQKYSRIKAELFHSLTSDNGMQQLVNTASKIIGNPIGIGIIDNTAWYTSPDMPKDAVIEGLNLLEKNNIPGVIETVSKTIQKNGPVHLYREADHSEHINVSLHLNGITVGFFTVVLCNRDFQQEDMDIVAIFQDAFQLALKTDIGGTFLLKNNNSSKLLQSLFVGERTFLSRYALWEELGLQKERPLQILVANYPQSYGFKTPTLALKEKLVTVLNSDLYILKSDVVIFLCNSNLKEEKDTIEPTLNQLGLIAGVSHTFYKLEEFKQRYQQALEAINLGSYRNDSTLFFYEDYILYKVTEGKFLQGKLKEYCHPVAWELYQYDQKYNACLSKTLRMYFTCGRNIESTSKLLNIHRNTILQRLDKIVELTNSYALCADSLYNIYLSVLLIDFYLTKGREECD